MQETLKILVISMPEAEERRSKISLKLKDIDFEFIDGVDGRNLDISKEKLYLQKKRLAFFGKDLMGTEIGCFLAHQKAIKSGLESKYSLVLEDDVELSKDFFLVIEEILNSNLDFDIIRFLGHPKTIKQGCREVLKLQNYKIGRLKTAPGGGYAYLLSKKGAKKLLNYIDNNGTYLPIDSLLGYQWETGLDGYVILSKLATSSEDTSISYIGQDRFDKSSNQNKPKYFFLTRAYFKITSAIKKNILFYRRYILACINNKIFY